MQEEKILKFKINRILANSIDALVVFVLFWACFVFPFINFLNDALTGSFNATYFTVMIIAAAGGLSLGIIYLFVSPIILSNATCGLKINGLRFENVDKTPIRERQLLWRAFFSVILVVFSCGLSVFAEIFSVILSEQGREFYDYFTGVRVVNYDLN